ncbi:helix-turn-helix domain-containing protein [Rhizomicrobium electricum]|uniref:HTH cro/C1-type domain-containing protein n=1 Tax=Rhizomicrobium electricum TaxID=480070 RepID=A0ABN1FBD8_9PROT|nr:helix-turn-helix transcriptional regulator [Rhizomicrobium electricum]NIJ50738.1 transcriptional regulator with XRE-family HTH domain [Rhizomicrobium electricum]
MARLEHIFGKRVREMRIGLGMTQPQLAEAIDMSVEWVRRIEQGGASPSFETITALAKALNVRPQDLFGETSPPLASRISAAVQGLSEEQVAWLIDGARLLQQSGFGSAGGRAARPRRGRGSAAKKVRKRT